MSEIKRLPVQNVIPDPNQPRKAFDDEKIRELAQSIKEHGLLQPILVRPMGMGKYQLVHGERRWRACKLIGLETIKAEVRKLDDKQVLEIQLVENLQRENLNPIEEAETFQRMISECAYTHEKIAERIGKSREYVTKRLRLLKLPLAIQEKIREGTLTSSHGEIILSLKELEKLENIANTVIENQLTIRQTRDLVGSITNPEANVLRRTSDVPKDGLVIGVWVSNQNYSSLLELASSKKLSIEKLCSQIIEEEVSKNE